MNDELALVGARLRAARHSAGLSLNELATRVGMSTSTLSRLEAGKRQASLELLIPLVSQLGIRIDDLVRPGPRDPRVRRAVVRRDGLVIVPLAPERSPIHTFKITYPPVERRPAPRVHQGYEWLYVLSGRLQLQLGDREHVLVRGDAAEFDTQIPHAMNAVGGTSAEVLSIFSGEGIRMHTPFS